MILIVTNSPIPCKGRPRLSLNIYIFMIMSYIIHTFDGYLVWYWIWSIKDKYQNDVLQKILILKAVTLSDKN
jgi:hypothetical protein